jgi:hypothetical protein
MKIKLIMLVGLFTLGFAFSATAGSVTDTDTDLVPDVFDNCDELANGPAEGSNQVDSNQDGYGNACDADYNNDTFTDVTDFGVFLASFTGTFDADTDHNGDGFCNVGDFSTFLAFFTAPAADQVGPSGLACAGTIPCTP